MGVLRMLEALLQFIAEVVYHICYGRVSEEAVASWNRGGHASHPPAEHPTSTQDSVEDENLSF